MGWIHSVHKDHNSEIHSYTKKKRPTLVTLNHRYAQTQTLVIHSVFCRRRKVAGSIPDEVIGFYNWPNHLSRIMGLGSTKPLTEVSKVR
jgi:hypothetical protein